MADLIVEHNHTLIATNLALNGVSKEILELQGLEIEIADDVGIGPKATHQLASLQDGG